MEAHGGACQAGGGSGTTRCPTYDSRGAAESLTLKPVSSAALRLAAPSEAASLKSISAPQITGCLRTAAMCSRRPSMLPPT